MKQLLIILLALCSFAAKSQTILYTNNPDSFKVAGSVNGAPRTMWNIDLGVKKVDKTKHTTDSAALRGLITTNTAAINSLQYTNSYFVNKGSGTGILVTINDSTVAANRLGFTSTANKVIWTVDSTNGLNFNAAINEGNFTTLAPLASPTFTGTPLIGTDTVATRAYARSVSGTGGSGSSESYSQPVLLMRGMGMNVVSQTVGFNNPIEATTAHTLVSGRLSLYATAPTKSETITGVYIYTVAQGSFTGSSTNGIALYSFNPTTGVYTKVAESANDANIWKAAAQSTTSILFTSSVSVAAGTTYFIATMFSSSATTTSPTILSRNVAANAGQSKLSLYGNAGSVSGYLTSQTAFPATIAATSLTEQTLVVWGALRN
ncbi:MAG TPA: hypothetical protein VF622_11730 [Segetibacter sp.]|jgi:hypothetical protein